MAGKPKFDPSQPFQAADSGAKPKFDPSAPFQVSGASAPAEDSGFAATLGRIGDAGKKYVNETASGIGEAAKKYGSAISLNPLKNAKMTVEGVANLASGALQQPVNLFSSDPEHPAFQVPRFEGDNPITDVVGAISKPLTDVVSGVSNVAGDVTGVNPRRIEAGLNTAAMAVPALKGLKGSAVAEIPKVLGRMDENPVAAARAFGDKVRPSDMAKAEPETSVKTTRATEGVAGSRQLRISLMEHNAKNGTSKAAIDLGGTGNEPRITQKFLDEKSAPHLATYRKVGRAAGDFDSANPSLKADLYAIADREGLHPDARADAAKAISEYSDRAMSGPDTVKSISTLRREAARNGRSDDPNMQAFGFTQRKIADAIEAQLGRQLEASGQAPLMQEFAGARQGLAKIHDVDTALKGGQVDRHVLLRLRNQGVPLTGNLAIMADSADMFKHVTKHPTSIADEGGGGVVPGIGPALDIASAGVRPAIRKFLGSDFYQNQLGKPATDLQAQLGEYFPKPPEPPKPAPPAPEPPPELPKTPSSAMLEAQKRAGDLSLADEIFNPEQLPEAPSRLHAEIPPASRGDLPFKASQPSGVDLAGDLGLAPEVTPGNIPGGNDPRAPGMSEQVRGTKLFPELRAIRSGKDVVEPPELSLVQENGGSAPTLPQGGSPALAGGPTPGFDLAKDLGIEIVPSMKRKGMFEVRHNGETEGVAFKSQAEAKSAALGLADHLLGEPETPYRAPPRVKNGPVGNGALPAEAFDNLFKEHSVAANEDAGVHEFKTKNGTAYASERNGYFRMERSDVAEKAQGNGEGKALVKAAIAKASELGLPYGSDISVSPAAERVYTSLKNEGFDVVQNPAERNKATGNLVSKDPRVPVFEVRSLYAEKRSGSR